MQSKDKKKPP